MSPGRYEIRIRGRLSASARSAFQATFGDMAAEVEPVETVLCGELEDQAALYGLLQHVEALGLELVEARRVAPGSPPTDRTDPPPPLAGPAVRRDDASQE